MPFPLSPASLQIQPASLDQSTHTVFRTPISLPWAVLVQGMQGNQVSASPWIWGKEALLRETFLLGCGLDNSTVCAFVAVSTLPSTHLFTFLAERGKCCQEKNCHCCHQDQGGILLTSSKDTWVKEENWNCIASVFRSYSSGPFTGELCLHHLARRHGFSGGCKRRIPLVVLEKYLHSLPGLCQQETHTNEWLHRLCTLFLLRLGTISLVITWLESTCGSEAENPPVGEHIKLLP